ncbi:MAG TPA: tripartite tricarboxylate transporter substrate binding protein, partial [Gemmatimonadales bacterium]|nr:tripartite tricarboxylate transporter substrate binding protein [Gemmatimonadales bacterium]
GGGADLMARLVAPKMSEALGQSIVVDNKPGAAGQIGGAFVAKAEPDGYTVLVDAASYVINPSLYPKMSYDTDKAFKPVGVLAVFPHVIVVTPSYEAKSVADLIDLAKAQPATINYASSGTGSAQHLAGAAFVQQTKIDLVHVPYKGGAPAMTDVMGGHVPLFFANVASGLSHIKAGKLRALAVGGERRISALPDTPTLAELGMQGSEVYEWNGMFVPAGTPDQIVNQLADALKKALASDDVKQRVAELGGELFAGGPAEAAQFIAEQRQHTATIIREGNIKAD